MKFLRILLTGLYCAVAAFGIFSVATGNVSPYASIFIAVYVAIAAALNRKGGSCVKWIAYGFSVIFIIFGILSLAMFVATFFGQEFDKVLVYAFALFGFLGFGTLISLKKQGQVL